jgi:hypothetical protein
MRLVRSYPCLIVEKIILCGKAIMLLKLLKEKELEEKGDELNPA